MMKPTRGACLARGVKDERNLGLCVARGKLASSSLTSSKDRATKVKR